MKQLVISYTEDLPFDCPLQRGSRFFNPSVPLSDDVLANIGDLVFYYLLDNGYFVMEEKK